MTATTARSAARLACVLAAALSAGCVVQPDNSDGTITIHNSSSYVLMEVRVAPVDQIGWGPNVLPNLLYSGERLTVSVACDTYDVLVSDEYGRDCVLGNLDLCFSDRIWRIDNSTLRNCGY